MFDIDSMPEFRSGNSVPVTRATISRERMQEAMDAYADARVREAQQWLPIDTAPKDGGTILLGYFNSHGNWRTVRGQWMSEDYIAEHWENPDDAEPGWFETAVEADDIPNCWRIWPTHWMPLPAPPLSVPEICQLPDKCEWGPRKDGDPIGTECMKCGLVIPF